MKSICIFCGSKSGNNPAFISAAQELGKLLAQKNIALVYGGATNGLMGEVANAALAHNGKVIGVIPTLIADRELAHKTLTELHIVDSMQTRKTKLLELSDAFICLPGGVGTMDELFEVLAFTHLGVSTKPCGLLNIQKYYEGIINFLDHGTASGFIPNEVRDHVVVEETVPKLVERILLFGN
jgi:hypothetical protein